MMGLEFILGEFSVLYICITLPAWHQAKIYISHRMSS
jgi:hypothetical protein